MEAYNTKQKVVDRTLTVELPEEFTGAEVEVVVLKIANSKSKSDKKERV